VTLVPVTTATLQNRLGAGVHALRQASMPPPWPTRWAWAADAILALALTIGGVNGALAHAGSTDSGPDPQVPSTPHGLPTAPTAPVFVQHYGVTHPWQIALVVLATAPVVVRRRFPVASLWVTMVASLAYHLSPGFDPTFTFTACVIAAYSAAMYSPYRTLAITSSVLGAGLLIGFHSGNVPTIRPGLVTLFVMIPVGLAANTIHTWKQRVRTLEQEREQSMDLAADRERARIARDLHDVVTHNVSVMVVQAGAARSVLDKSPEEARKALLAVERGGRAAMTELRNVMGLLTMSSEGAADAAASELIAVPGLDQLPDLVQQVRDAGLAVEVTVTGEPQRLPAAVDLAAYRVIQEALTNALKHAVGADVRVAVEHSAEMLRLEIVDSGGRPGRQAGTGDRRGLVGLRERLAAHAGTLETGERPGGGFRVHAEIPVVTV
jgi:signal transduction histidine kinase